MKALARNVLALYLLILLWLVLFKFSSDPLSVLANYHTRSLNVIPFAGVSRSHLHETAYNILAFIPLGLLLAIILKQADFWRKLAYIGIFSISIEIFQFIFAIGRTDINDVITNTFGGFLGLGLYMIGKRYVDNEKLDRIIIMSTLVLSVLFLILRIVILRVRYQAH